MRYGNHALGSLVCAAWLLFSVPAHGQTAAERAQAFEAYGRGQRLFNEQKYVEAQAAFEEAYKAVPNPVVLLGVAEAQQRQSLWTEAVNTLTRYLSEAPDSSDRTKVQQEIAAIEAALAPLVEETAVQQPAPPATSPVTIVHKSKMSSSYRLVKAVFAIDGTPILTRSDEKASASSPQQWVIPGAALTPGKHTLTVNLEYKSGTFGVFSYLDGYRYSLRSSHAFTIHQGSGLLLTVIAYERGGPTVGLGERPAVRYEEQITRAPAIDQATNPLARSDAR